MRILIAEDDLTSRNFLFKFLSKYGECDVVVDGLETLDAVIMSLKNNDPYDLICLDIMMPKMDGYEFAERLRNCGDNTPILMVTAKQLPEEKCRGFLVGTDDYMVKPVNENEMLLRIKALLRRSQIANERKLKIGKVVLDYDALMVTREGISQTLPQKEFYLLYKLLSYPNKIFTRLQLMDEIWGMESESNDTTVNVHVARLRKRFEDWSEFEILAIRGIGYKAVIRNEKIS